MNIPIELLVFLIILTFIIFWGMLMFVFKKIKLWRYKPENDKGRRAEENRRSGFTSLPRPVLSERRQLLPTANINDVGKIKQLVGETDRGNRETSRGNGKVINPFRRFR